LIEKVSFDYGKETIITVVWCSHHFTHGFKEVVDIHALIYV